MSKYEEDFYDDERLSSSFVTNLHRMEEEYEDYRVRTKKRKNLIKSNPNKRNNKKPWRTHDRTEANS